MPAEESKHISRVMRHTTGEEIFVTDGKGSIYKTSIIEVCSSTVTLRIVGTRTYENKFDNVTFCIPRLKSNDRFEFALEKSVELGITNFLVFNSDRTIAKGEKLDRWNKITQAAMKQSLRSYLPKIQFVKSIERIIQLEGKKYLFDQNADIKLKDHLINHSDFNSDQNYFIFGPEGGLSEKEISDLDSSELVALTPNRLRSETAIVTAASILSQLNLD